MDSEPICPSDFAAYPAPHLAVDLVLLTICEDVLKVLMMRRGQEPFTGQLVLPGGFVHPDEMLEEALSDVRGTGSQG